MTHPLLERIQIERRGAGGDDLRGNENTGWAPLGPVLRATIQESGGGEAVMAAKLQGRQMCVVHVRATNLTRSIVTSDRIRDMTNARDLKIRSVPAANRTTGYISIVCEAGVATG